MSDLVRFHVHSVPEVRLYGCPVPDCDRARRAAVAPRCPRHPSVTMNDRAQLPAVGVLAAAALAARRLVWGIGADARPRRPR